jgi:hypothetical protein
MGPKRLYTIDRFGHVFWDVKGDYGSEVFEVIERSGLDGEYNPLELGPVWDQLEETDPTGCAVPNEWP